MYMKTRSSTDAFTLVELLVVIAIIGLLVGILVPSLISAMGRGKKTICLSDIKEMQTALRIYESDYHDFPPSSLIELGLKKENSINAGIESLVVCLSSTAHGISYYSFKDEKLDNTDADSSAVPLRNLTGSSFSTNLLWELIDPWGNPYVYFHYRDLGPDGKQVYLIEQKQIKIVPNLVKTKTGKIQGHNTYQIISCGSDTTANSSDDLISE